MPKSCHGDWRIERRRRVTRWLRRHPDAMEYYKRAVGLLRVDLYKGEPLRALPRAMETACRCSPGSLLPLARRVHGVRRGCGL